MMNLTNILLLIIIALQIVVTIVMLTRNPNNAINKNAKEQRDEIANNAKETREEITQNAKHTREELSTNLNNFSSMIDERLKNLQEQVHNSNRDSRQEFTASRQELTQALQAIRKDNSDQLEKMRETVDEKLHKTLETRLGQSFELVSKQLEQVQKGLGEMTTLANDVGDLKKVLANVKTKGVLGEYQLDSLLEQMLSPNQYDKNVKTKKGSTDMVEFAVKIPSKDKNSNEFIYLPIDAKLPTSNYENLVNAYDVGDPKLIEQFTKELSKNIKNFAKDISTKYIDPPNTTEFAIMFLPFEGLYAEVLRIPSLFEDIQREFHVTITGPTTISAFLNSLQMGFRSLAVEKRTGEVWKLLANVQKEFASFGDVLEKTKDKIDQAGKELEKAGTRSRAIERQLKKVDELPE